ncbi:hypothetical protein D9M73_270450 [compost metagenome]
MLVFPGVPAMPLIHVQVAPAQLRVARGERLQGGLEPVAVVQGARFDQPQVAGAEGADQQGQLDVAVRVLNTEQGAHGERRFH